MEKLKVVAKSSIVIATELRVNDDETIGEVDLSVNIQGFATDLDTGEKEACDISVDIDKENAHGVVGIQAIKTISSLKDFITNTMMAESITKYKEERPDVLEGADKVLAMAKGH